MAELTREQVNALGDALGLPMDAEDLSEVTHRLNALLEALAPLAELPLGDEDPVPILPEDGE
jgi:hypothetical protein